MQARWPEGSASTVRLSGMTPGHLFVLPFLELRQSSSSLHPWPCPERASRPFVSHLGIPCTSVLWYYGSIPGTPTIILTQVSHLLSLSLRRPSRSISISHILIPTLAPRYNPYSLHFVICSCPALTCLHCLLLLLKESPFPSFFPSSVCLATFF